MQYGNIDWEDFSAKVLEHKDNLAALMVTYPSTHGVYEVSIVEICQIIHDNGGQVYMDGANMNAQVGVSKPWSYGLRRVLTLTCIKPLPYLTVVVVLGWPNLCGSAISSFFTCKSIIKTGGEQCITAISGLLGALL